MKWFRAFVAGMIAVLWLPLSVHCHLEQIPSLDFLSCCPEQQSVPHQDSDCETDACAVVESGLYKSEERQVALPEPVYVPDFEQDLTSLQPSCAPLEPISLSPPELPSIWQFALRTAHPPRAPSLFC